MPHSMVDRWGLVITLSILLADAVIMFQHTILSRKHITTIN